MPYKSSQYISFPRDFQKCVEISKKRFSHTSTHKFVPKSIHCEYVIGSHPSPQTSAQKLVEVEAPPRQVKATHKPPGVRQPFSEKQSSSQGKNLGGVARQPGRLCERSRMICEALHVSYAIPEAGAASWSTTAFLLRQYDTGSYF